ncbi:MAG: phospholipase A [Oligoflexus sp.]|nr:phospholipase A [Oligoflexus sp.]
MSLFHPVYRKILNSTWDLNVAYTHYSWWQIYNAHWSKLFRETSYNPEIFARLLFPEHFDLLGVRIFNFDLGYMHESNGQIQLVSRSWDRFFARSFFLSDSYTGTLTVWTKNQSLRKMIRIQGFSILKDMAYWS